MKKLKRIARGLLCFAGLHDNKTYYNRGGLYKQCQSCCNTPEPINRGRWG